MIRGEEQNHNHDISNAQCGNLRIFFFQLKFYVKLTSVLFEVQKMQFQQQALQIEILTKNPK